MIDDLSSVRQAARSLTLRPAFTAVVVLILALGIGANTALFSLVYDVLLRPLSYPQPERLVQLWPEDYVDKLIAVTVAERARSFAWVSPYFTSLFSLSGGGEAASIKGARVGTDFFRVLDLQPALGRAFSAEEGRPGRDKVVVLSDGLWRRRFGASRDIVGRSVLIDGEAHTILGVMPAGFRPLEVGWELWLPIAVNPADAQDFQGSFYLKLIARLAPGRSARQAERELRSIGEDLRRTYPNLITREKMAAAAVVPLQEQLVKTVRPILLALLGAVGLVLLIACGNVATLLLARAVRRRREIAVRAALGAQRGRLAREAATESLLLGLAGGVAGLVLAGYLLRFLPSRLPVEVPRAGEIGIDGPVLAFNLGLSFLAAFVFGLWPARRASRTDLLQELNVEGGGAIGQESRRFGRFLVAAQIALAVVLLVNAGLLLKSLGRLQAVSPGFRADDVLTFRLDLPATRYKEPAQIVGYYQQALLRLQGLPGVERVGGIHLLPLTADNWSFPYLAQDHPVLPGTPAGTSLPNANFRVVTPGYFDSVGIRLVEGRAFSETDAPSAPAVGLINRTLAEQLWPGRSALGKTLRHFGDGGPSFTVVGVVTDVHQDRLDQAPKPEIYRPYTQWPVASMYLMIHSRLPPAALVPPLRSAVWQLDPEIPISDVRSLADLLASSLVNERSTSLLVALFAAFSLLLALTGIYGIINYSVKQRTREVGLRLALGAQRGDILHQILTEGISTAALGLAGGFLGAFACARLITSHLFETSTADPQTYLVVGGLILVCALASSWLPAWRAARISPLASLKSEPG